MLTRLDDGSVRRALALIERYGLHDDDAILPVPIRQVAKDEGWVVQYHSRMGGACAMAFVVGPVQLMYVNANLIERVQRIGIAHEMGHILAGHALEIDACMTVGHEHEWLARRNDRQEDEAQLIAAMLLIPAVLRDAPLSVAEVAETCCVTPQLVARYRDAAWVALEATG